MGKIGTIDHKETKKLLTRVERQNYTFKRQASKQIEAEANDQSDDLEDDISVSVDPNEIDEYKPSTSKNKPTPWQMRVKLSATALHSDRYGVSDRAAAAIASGVLEDIGLVTESESCLVIDRYKIRRGKSCCRKKLQVDEMLQSDEPQAIYFDGRKDDTLIIERVESKQFRRILKEEHYSIIAEPGSSYLGHVSPKTGSADDIANSILSYLNTNNISLDNLDLVGCDGTNTNTGWKGGAIKQLEVHVGRPLQWAVCLLHFIELPLRHLFQHLDGVTTGPRSFSGPIGQKLKSCETLPVVNFTPMECDIPNVDRKLLSKDQRYLLDISNAVKSGECPNDLSKREPGPISHARWLTSANRVLRLYVSEDNPSDALKDLVTFILKSYMPVWFEIKCSKYITDGPVHVYKSIETTRYLSDELKNIIHPVIERNSYFAHPENLLLAMVFDERKHIRELGLRRVLKARQTVSKGKNIRSFITPTLNFNARDYTELIDWSATKLSPPPLLRKVSNEEITSIIQSGNAPNWAFKSLPCHTQAVERCVKLVTEASAKVCGQESRDGYIRATLKSRAMMPEFTNKSQYRTTNAKN